MICTQTGRGDLVSGKGGKGGSRKAGGGGGASAEPDDSNVESKFSALGTEIQYGNEVQNPSNSRLFEAHRQVGNLSEWRAFDAETQASMIDSMTIQLGETRGTQSAFNRRANKDVETLWNNTRAETKEFLARSNFATDAPTRSPAYQKIQRDVQQVRTRLEAQRQRERAKASSKPAQRDSFDDFFDSL